MDCTASNIHNVIKSNRCDKECIRKTDKCRPIAWVFKEKSTTPEWDVSTSNIP